MSISLLDICIWFFWMFFPLFYLLCCARISTYDIDNFFCKIDVSDFIQISNLIDKFSHKINNEWGQHTGFSFKKFTSNFVPQTSFFNSSFFVLIIYYFYYIFNLVKNEIIQYSAGIWLVLFAAYSSYLQSYKYKEKSNYEFQFDKWIGRTIHYAGLIIALLSHNIENQTLQFEKFIHISLVEFKYQYAEYINGFFLFLFIFLITYLFYFFAYKFN